MNNYYINNDEEFNNILNQLFDESIQNQQNEKYNINLYDKYQLEQFYNLYENKIIEDCNICMTNTLCIKCFDCNFYYCYFCFIRTFIEFNKCSSCNRNINKNNFNNHNNNQLKKYNKLISNLQISQHSLCIEINYYIDKYKNKLISNNKKFLYGIYDLKKKKLIFHSDDDNDNIIEIDYLTLSYQIQILIRTILKNVLQIKIKNNKSYWNDVTKIINLKIKNFNKNEKILYNNLLNIYSILISS